MLKILQKSQEIHHIIVQGQVKIKEKILDLIGKYQDKHMISEKRQQIIDDQRLI